MVIGVIAAIAVDASLYQWHQTALPYEWSLVGVLALYVAYDIFRPKWLARRLQRGGGVVKITGGFKSPNGREIEYADGTKDVDVYGKGTAEFASLAVAVAGKVTHPTRLARLKQRLRKLRTH